MLEVQADLMRHRGSVGWLVFTANSELTGDGRLVMGAGIARQVRDSLPGIDRYFGQQLAQSGLRNQVYGLMVCSERRVIALQTKTDWRLPSTLELVRQSCSALGTIAKAASDHTFGMTRPGCGHGGLSWSQVRAMVAGLLPDNVYIFSL